MICEPKKISQLNYAEHLSDEAIFPIVQDEDNYVIQAKDLIDQIIKKITGADNPDALSIALYAKELAEHADSNADQALKDVASALAYATKAYQMVCQFEDRLSELESHWAFIQKLKNTFYNLVEQISNLSIEIENLWNSKVVRIEQSQDNNSTIYIFYQDDEKVGEVVVPRGGIYRGSQYINISSDNVISLKNLGRAAYTNNYWHLDNLPTKLSQFENDVPFLTAKDLCCDDLYDLIQKLTKRVEALERCCAQMHNNYQVYLTLGEGVNASDTRAQIEVVKGYKYVNQFTLKPGYENLKIVCTPNTATINNGTISIVVQSDVSIVVTATKTSVTPTTHTISWNDPTGQITIDGHSSGQETVNHLGSWGRNVVIPEDTEVKVLVDGREFVTINSNESNFIVLSDVDADHTLTFEISEKTLYKFEGVNNGYAIFFYGTQTSKLKTVGDEDVSYSEVGEDKNFINFKAKKLNTETGNYEIFTDIHARLKEGNSNKITIGQCGEWQDRNNSPGISEPYWVHIPIEILPKDSFAAKSGSTYNPANDDEIYKIDLYYIDDENNEVIIDTVKISVKDLESTDLYEDPDKPYVQFFYYANDGAAYVQGSAPNVSSLPEYHGIIPPSGGTNIKEVSTDVPWEEFSETGAATMHFLIRPFGIKNILTERPDNKPGYTIRGNQIIYCYGTLNEVIVTLNMSDNWLTITNLEENLNGTQDEAKECIQYTLNADANTTNIVRYAVLTATISGNKLGGKTFSSHVQFKQEPIS